MTQMTRDMLMAYADGQLTSEERSEVEAHLGSNPEAAADVALQQRQNDAIRTLFAPVGAEPVPDRLRVERLAAAHKRGQWRMVQQAAMIVAVLGIGIAVGWMLREGGDRPALHDQLIADAVSAHTVYVAENRHAVEVGGDDAAHLSTWLSNRLATTLAMPDLKVQGLSFLGGRLLPAPAIPGGRAAQLMYEDAAGKRLTLYITPSSGVGGPSYEEVDFGTDTALYWSNALITCTIVGEGSAATMEAIAAAVFSQLTPGTAAPIYRG